jgi:uncharacterized protein YbjT (DUF2867 family)
VGGAVVEALVNRGISVRAATRKTNKITWTDQVQPVTFDFGDPNLHKAALDGISGLFLIAPPLDIEAPAKLMPFIDKAGEMRVKHIVFLSALSADLKEQNPLGIIERYLKKSGLGYTILRPNFFMENFSTGYVAPMIMSGEISLPAGDGKTSFISVGDIAEVAATIFQEKEKHYGVEYNLTGPEALSYGQVAAIISTLSVIRMTYHPISEGEMIEGARANGMPESAIRYMAALYSMVRKGLMAAVTDDVKKVTGKDPIGFAEFARRNSMLWMHRARLHDRRDRPLTAKDGLRHRRYQRPCGHRERGAA